ncbi:calcium-binding protein [Inquilinus sp.]|jgi:Ca2+-binding RTX toxin-like protein|uniref:calcium-binding protein n=1 Tax=Inquilinus sp. TaxID=1932117 RepID=UPI003784898F
MALGFFMVPPGYSGPVPPGYTLVVYSSTQQNGGSAFDDIVIGSDVGDTGHIGATWTGEGGYDILDYSGFSQGIRIDEIEGAVRDSDGIIAHIAAIPTRGFEEYQGTAFDDVIVTAAGDAVALHGNGGNDTLVGGANAELLDGGADIDTASYANSAVGVTVDLRLSTAQVSAGDANGDTLAGIENLTGSALADSLHGNSGDNVLTGPAGADALVGGAGTDTADYSGSAAGVTVDLSLGTGVGGDAQGDTLTTIENLTGSAFADHLTGDAGVNVLSGGAGDDTLHGGAGTDTLTGGAGSDFANYQGSASAVTVDLLAGTAAGGDAAGDTLTGIENLYGSSFDDHLTGDNDRNIIGGEIGDDTLAGNGGDDSLSGEAGNDALSGGDGADRLVGGLGIDTIHGGTGADSIDAGNDIVFGEAGNDTVYGGAGIDQIDGGDGNDILEGAAGTDTLAGGAGVDTISYASSAAGVTINLATGAASDGDAAGDTFSGIEQVLGSAQNDALTGNSGANTLWGLAGNDVLTGGGGADLLKGGAGSDSFVYGSIAASTVAASGKDTIADFTAGDRIDLSGIDADGNPASGDAAFSFGTGGFTGHAGGLRVVTAGAIQMVYADIDGDEAPDFAINVVSDHALTAGDFVL